MLRQLLVLATLAAAQVSSFGAEPVLHVFLISDGDGHRSLLIPSIHVPAFGIAQPSSSMVTAASRLVIEHAGTGTSASDTEGGTRLAPWAVAMTAAQRRTYDDRARCAGRTPEEAEAALHRPSVQVANMYAYASCAMAGRPSRDVVLAVAALQRGVPLVALEDDVWVEQQRLKIPARVQEEAFRWILDRDVDAVLQPMVQAFNSGDFDAVARLWAASYGSPQNARIAYVPMVIERNLQWMTVLPQLLDEGGSIIDVGAMHIPGPQGLVALLRARGYQVEPITLPASL